MPTAPSATPTTAPRTSATRSPTPPPTPTAGGATPTPPVNDSDPGAVNDTITLAEGATATTLPGGQASVLWNDTDADLPADTLSVALASGPSFGLLTLRSEGPLGG